MNTTSPKLSEESTELLRDRLKYVKCCLAELDRQRNVLSIRKKAIRDELRKRHVR